MNLEKSLQRLKADLANKETTLKAIQNHYPHLANFPEKEMLEYSDDIKFLEQKSILSFSQFIRETNSSIL